MTAEQARRAAEILRGLATSLRIAPFNETLKTECYDLSRALESYAERKQTVGAAKGKAGWPA